MSCLNFGCCAGEEDGIFPGESRPLAHHYHTTLTNLFKSELLNKKINGSKPALVFGSTELTFSELDHLSSAAAVNIEKHIGTEFIVTNPDEELLIGICLPLSEKIIPLVFAILKLGAAFLPLDPEDPEDLLLTIINKFRPVMVITDDNGPILSKYDAKSFAEYSRLMSIEEIWLEMELPPEGDPKWEQHVVSRQIQLIEPPIPTPPHSRPALVVNTTGVSGNPRGVRIGHMAIINRCLWEWKEYPFKDSTVSGLTTSIYKAEGLIQIFSSLLKGVTLHLFRRNESFKMSSLINKLHEKKVSRLYFTSNHFADFVQTCEKLGKESEEFENLEFVCCAGDRLVPFEIAKTFFSVFHSKITLVTYYGGPETCGNMMYTRIKNGSDLGKKGIHERVVLNKVMTNCRVYILSNYLELTKDGVQGEICLAGEALALGYVNMKEEEDEQRFVSNPHDERKNFSKLFRTGEYGRIEKRNGSRYVYMEGRLDTQIFIRGFPVLVEEVQELLKGLDKVEDSQLCVYRQGKSDQLLIGFVLPKENVRNSLTAKEIRDALAKNMPEYLIPEIKMIEEVPTVPRGITYRVRPSLLIRLYEGGLRSNYSAWGSLKYSDEKLKAFKLLAGAMYKFAGIPIEMTANSLDSSFYDLGGTSLNTLSVLLYLNQQNCSITIKDWVSVKDMSELLTVVTERMVKTQEISSNDEPNPVAVASVKKDKVVKNNEDFKIAIASDLCPTFASLSTMKSVYEITIASYSSLKDINDLLSKAYADKGILQRYNLVRYNDFYQYFLSCGEGFMQQKLSLIATRVSDGKIVACSLNQEFYTILPENTNTKYKQLNHLLEYTQELKGSVVHRIPHIRDSIFEISWMGTDSSLSPGQNVAVLTLLMHENIKLSNIEQYTSIFCLATNPFCKELLIDVYDFQVLDDYPAKLFSQAANVHPFRVSPSTVTTSICWLVTGKLPSATSSMQPSRIDGFTTEQVKLSSDGKGDGSGSGSGSTEKRKK